MSDDVEVIEIGASAPAEIAYEEPDPVAGARVVSIVSHGNAPTRATRLVELSDVLATGSPEPTALVRDPTTGVFHTRPLSELVTTPRGSAIHYVTEAPASPPAAARPGDYVHVIAGPQAGTVYEVQED